MKKSSKCEKREEKVFHSWNFKTCTKRKVKNCGGRKKKTENEKKSFATFSFLLFFLNDNFSYDTGSKKQL